MRHADQGSSPDRSLAYFGLNGTDERPPGEFFSWDSRRPVTFLLPSEIVRPKSVQVVKFDGVVVARRMQHHAVRRRARLFVADIGVAHETSMVIDGSPPVRAVPNEFAAGFAASLDFLEAPLLQRLTFTPNDNKDPPRQSRRGGFILNWRELCVWMICVLNMTKLQSLWRPRKKRVIWQR